MGYRSDVAIAIPQTTFIELKKICEDWDQKHQPEWGCKDLLACADEVREFVYSGENWVLITWNCIKWFSYMDLGSEMAMENTKTPIDVVEYFVKNLPEYQFIRIGESSEDTEVHFSGDEQLFFVKRTIELAI